ncbi:MAG: ATP-binding protein [Methanospirillum sp.]
MIETSPFSQEILNEIFRIHTKYLDRVCSRECSWLEFKKSFGWKSLAEYLRSCAAFANTKGGYIVYGINDRPHSMLGLQGPNLKAFENIKPELLTQHFNDHFSPEIRWDIQQYELDGKMFGLLYVHESLEKPIFCCRSSSSDTLREGAIYYRYRGRTQHIKYPELRAILDTIREKERKLWMQHLATIAKIGVQGAAIFDIDSGLVTGAEGAFIIDESLLSQLSFIKEGEFSEVKGKPTLKLIGSVEPIGNPRSILKRKEIMKVKGIRFPDIVLAFLNNTKVDDPTEYIRQICFENSAFLPVYYYISAANVDVGSIIEMLNAVVVRSSSKRKIIERLTNASTLQLFFPQRESPTVRIKKEYYSQILSHSVDPMLSGKELEYCLQTIRHLTPEEISEHRSYLQENLRTWFNKNYASAEGSLADSIRRSICWVDEALFMGG